MLKNIILLFVLFLTLTKIGVAQEIKINKEALLAGTATTSEIAGYYYQEGYGGIGILDLVAGLRAEPMSGKEIPLNRITATLRWKGIDRNKFILSEGGETLFRKNNNTGSGAFSMKFSAENLSSFAWIAGIYSIEVKRFRDDPWWATTRPDITPNSTTLKINVEAFISDLPSIDNFELRISDFAFYRNRGASILVSPSYLATVPFNLWLRGLNNVFKFENGVTGVVAPATTLSRIKTELSVRGSVALGPKIASTSAVIIGAVPSVLIGNKSYMDLKVSISPEDLRTGFINKGTYANTLNLEGREVPPAGSSSSVTTKKDFGLNIIVDDMSELVLNQQNVNFVFGTVQDYQNGIAIEMPNHLTVSKTTPFDIAVRAETKSFSSASGTIPIGVLKVGPAAAETNVNNLGSVTDVNQILVSASPAAIDKSFSIKYHIPKTETEKLITSKSGSYTVNLIYTLTTH